METEIWKDIVGYEGLYQVSNLGRVKSLDRIVEHKKAPLTIKERILKQRLGGKQNRYYSVCLWKNSNGKIIYVHKLVAETFLEKKENTVIDHIDNDSKNNKLTNLQYISQRKNSTKDKKGYSSKYPGVHFEKQRNKWIARIRYKNKNIFLGRFNSEIDANLAYINELKKYE